MSKTIRPKSSRAPLLLNLLLPYNHSIATPCNGADAYFKNCTTVQTRRLPGPNVNGSRIVAAEHRAPGPVNTDAGLFAKIDAWRGVRVGRRSATGNRVGGLKPSRGFESLPLRFSFVPPLPRFAYASQDGGYTSNRRASGREGNAGVDFHRAPGPAPFGRVREGSRTGGAGRLSRGRRDGRSISPIGCGGQQLRSQPGYGLYGIAR